MAKERETKTIRNTGTGEIVLAKKIPFTPGWRMKGLSPILFAMPLPKSVSHGGGFCWSDDGITGYSNDTTEYFWFVDYQNKKLLRTPSQKVFDNLGLSQSDFKHTNIQGTVFKNEIVPTRYDGLLIGNKGVLFISKGLTQFQYISYNSIINPICESIFSEENVRGLGYYAYNYGTNFNYAQDSKFEFDINGFHTNPYNPPYSTRGSTTAYPAAHYDKFILHGDIKRLFTGVYSSGIPFDFTFYSRLKVVLTIEENDFSVDHVFIDWDANPWMYSENIPYWRNSFLGLSNATRDRNIMHKIAYLSGNHAGNLCTYAVDKNGYVITVNSYKDDLYGTWTADMNAPFDAYFFGNGGYRMSPLHIYGDFQDGLVCEITDPLGNATYQLIDLVDITIDENGQCAIAKFDDPVLRLSEGGNPSILDLNNKEVWQGHDGGEAGSLESWWDAGNHFVMFGGCGDVNRPKQLIAITQNAGQNWEEYWGYEGFQLIDV